LFARAEQRAQRGFAALAQGLAVHGLSSGM
jgi:hypothetical protein